jgi:hypothetical protein
LVNGRSASSPGRSGSSYGTLLPPFRLEDDPLCDDFRENFGGTCGCFGKSWVAYDPGTGQLPFLATDGQTIATFNQVFNWVVWRYEIQSLGPDGCTEWRPSPFLLFGAGEGWFDVEGFGNLTQLGLIAPGATSIRVRSQEPGDEIRRKGRIRPCHWKSPSALSMCPGSGSLSTSFNKNGLAFVSHETNNRSARVS